MCSKEMWYSPLAQGLYNHNILWLYLLKVLKHR